MAMPFRFTAMMLLLGFIVAQEASLPALPAHMAKHTFCFVVGAHHSGTTLTDLLLAQHANATALRGTHKPEDEGQHLQEVYKRAYQLGGIMQFPWHAESHLTEESSLVTSANRQALWDAWAPFWNQSAHLLVEKSPRHITMTRYLQAIFTPEQSRFVAVLRHPFGAWHWAFANRWDYASASCGTTHVLQWLKLYEDLEQDLKHVKHAVVFQYERLTNSSLAIAQALVDRLMTRVGLPPTVDISMDHSNKSAVKHATVVAQLKEFRPKLFDEQGNYKDGEAELEKVVKAHLERLAAMRQAKREANAANAASAKHDRAPPAPREVVHHTNIARPQQDLKAALGADAIAVEDLIRQYRQGQLVDDKVPSRRRLLGYWGGERSEVKIHAGTTFEWVADWRKHVDMSSLQCQRLVTQFEARVNRFGYSLVDLLHYEPPVAFQPWSLER
eukprot:m.37707 g.37707  ORF g.37707 m.37707 type:complete len:443 (+) comp12536_c0_seq1:141-1469(+)